MRNEQRPLEKDKVIQWYSCILMEKHMSSFEKRGTWEASYPLENMPSHRYLQVFTNNNIQCILEHLKNYRKPRTILLILSLPVENLNWYLCFFCRSPWAKHISRKINVFTKTSFYWENSINQLYQVSMKWI